MDISKLLTLFGNLLFALGLLLMVYSYRYNSKVMGLGALGISTVAPNEDSPEWKAKGKMRRISDILFYVGIILTFLGIILQTIGVL